jgi:acetyltransferase-like isoleucine patch superfamily enzyme
MHFIYKFIRTVYSRLYFRLLSKKYGSLSIVMGKHSMLFPSSLIRIYAPKENAVVIGSESAIRGEIVILGHGGGCHIGDYCFVGSGTRLWSAKSITIGDRVLISHNVNIFDSQTHPISARKRHEEFIAILSSGFPKENALGEKNVVIEDDVLIGAAAIILRGVRIGQGSIVGAGSVVVHDVPPWTIVAGNPARIIREIPENER